RVFRHFARKRERSESTKGGEEPGHRAGPPSVFFRRFRFALSLLSRFRAKSALPCPPRQGKLCTPDEHDEQGVGALQTGRLLQVVPSDFEFSPLFALSR